MLLLVLLVSSITCACVSARVLKVDTPNRKCAAASVTSKELLSDGTSSPFKPQD